MDKQKLNLFKRLQDNLFILLPLIIRSFVRIGNIANVLDLRAYGLLKKRSDYAVQEPSQAAISSVSSQSRSFVQFCLDWHTNDRTARHPDVDTLLRSIYDKARRTPRATEHQKCI